MISHKLIVRVIFMVGKSGVIPVAMTKITRPIARDESILKPPNVRSNRWPECVVGMIDSKGIVMNRLIVVVSSRLLLLIAGCGDGTDNT